VRELTLPASRESLAALTAGEEIALTGPLYLARDATHARIAAELERDGRLPYGLEGQVLFYAGPTPPRAGRLAGAVGPTTAKRMDSWTPALLAAGIVGAIGKGPRADEVRRAFDEYGAIYFVAVGGSAALYARRVISVKPVAYPDLGPEALVRMEVARFPVFVALDAHGGDLYRDARAAPDAPAPSVSRAGAGA
jgi:fumarate hydratase subunit beta